MMLGAAAVLEPAHQGGVAAGHLHAVHAEVKPVLAARTGSLGNHQWPGDQRGRLARPAGLDRQCRKVDVTAAQDDFLARRGADGARPHRHHRPQQRQHLQRLTPATGRLRLLEERQRLTDLAQLVRLAVHAPGDPLDGAEEIDQHRHFIAAAGLARDVLEQRRGSAVVDQPRLDLGYLQIWRDPRRHPRQPPSRLEPVDEVAQAGIRHAGYMGALRYIREHPGNTPPFARQLARKNPKAHHLSDGEEDMAKLGALYDEDFVRWTEQQAAGLRRAQSSAGAGGSNLPLDWENLAEEIESLGKSDRRELTSQVRRILRHLLKLEASPAIQPQPGWRATIIDARREIAGIWRDS